MDENDKWNGAIFPMTDDPKKEPFQDEKTVDEFLRHTLQNIEDHKFYYGVHNKVTDWNRVLRAWRGEIMLNPFPSDRLKIDAMVFFRWHNNLYGYGKIEKVIANNRADLNFPLDGTWQCCIYPYIVKFYDNSIQVAETPIPQEIWGKAIGRDMKPLGRAYLELSIEKIKSLMALF